MLTRLDCTIVSFLDRVYFLAFVFCSCVLLGLASHVGRCLRAEGCAVGRRAGVRRGAAGGSGVELSGIGNGMLL